MSESPAHQAIRKKMRINFPHYAEKALKIRTKKDGVKPFIMNEAQHYIHEQAEKMFAERGYIRIILLKGRQQGASTYIEGRFYWKVTHAKGVRAFILTHEGEATANLFGMAKRYHEKMPEFFQPSCDKDNGNELNFDLLDSGYKVGTAGTKDVGRSSTIQFFHGSEVAFWPNAQDHARGVMQAVPKGAGEIWLESTSDGIGNYFYEVWRLAEQGKNDFLPLFIPWFWQTEYQLEIEGSFVRDENEEEYAELVHNYHGYTITDEQLNFRRDKINGEFGGEVDSFKREYPATPQEAFENAGISQFISGELANTAFAPKNVKPYGALVMGVDCARFGDDRTVIYSRCGRVASKLHSLAKKDQMEIVGYVKRELDAHKYDRCFIDVGCGIGVIDRLHEMGYDEVQAVDFGSRALDKDKYVNKRNEMYGEFKDWLEDGPVVIYDEDDNGKKSDETLADVCSVHYKFDSKSRKVLERKEETKKRLGYSPDSGDGIVLTFAEPVAMAVEDDYQETYDESQYNAMGY